MRLRGAAPPRISVEVWRTSRGRWLARRAYAIRADPDPGFSNLGPASQVRGTVCACVALYHATAHNRGGRLTVNIARAAVASLLACTMTDALAQQRADAVLIVNSSSAHYADAQTRIQPYLDHFGVPYTVLDIATTRIGPDIGNYALIIIGHAGLDIGGHLLDAAQ